MSFSHMRLCYRRIYLIHHHHPAAGSGVIGGDSGNVAAFQKEPKSKAKKRVKPVYVPPTQQDLQNIFIELESSEPLPISSNNIINSGESSVNRVKSAIASLQSLMEQKTIEMPPH
ncbi:hypothetical protein QTG54_012694 [Skeletonema marinoi]|uniref:Uncharacterized protein n=1 Tax=Skeletonema marinoi TaxID=267567 RepID=A0AAD8Y0A4_9STRA|nr:hypothetical protein QTG54_012694 [Skeletonema marinoi]